MVASRENEDQIASDLRFVIESDQMCRLIKPWEHMHIPE